MDQPEPHGRSDQAADPAKAGADNADANNAGLYIELDAILAVVIGGTPLTGGRFNLPGSLVGALLIQTLSTAIKMRSVPVEYTLVVKAVVVLGVCLLQSEELRNLIWRKGGRA